jgi:SAM-dependent methyltransferase
MLGQLAVERGARILDVGCGGGALLDRLARVGFNNLFGADPIIAADVETSSGVSLVKQYLSAGRTGYRSMRHDISLYLLDREWRG